MIQLEKYDFKFIERGREETPITYRKICEIRLRRDDAANDLQQEAAPSPRTETSNRPVTKPKPPVPTVDSLKKNYMNQNYLILKINQHQRQLEK